jgi:hypothetical protein
MVVLHAGNPHFNAEYTAFVRRCSESRTDSVASTAPETEADLLDDKGSYHTLRLRLPLEKQVETPSSGDKR